MRVFGGKCVLVKSCQLSNCCQHWNSLYPTRHGQIKSAKMARCFLGRPVWLFSAMSLSLQTYQVNFVWVHVGTYFKIVTPVTWKPFVFICNTCMIQLLSTASLSKSLFSCIIQFLGSTLAIRVFVSMKPVWCCTQNSSFPSKNVCWFEALVDPNMCDRNVEQVKSACLHYPLLPPHPKKSHGAFSASSTSSIMVVLHCGCKETFESPNQGGLWNSAHWCAHVAKENITFNRFHLQTSSFGSHFHLPKAFHYQQKCGVNGSNLDTYALISSYIIPY